MFCKGAASVVPFFCFPGRPNRVKKMYFLYFGTLIRLNHLYYFTLHFIQSADTNCPGCVFTAIQQPKRPKMLL